MLFKKPKSKPEETALSRLYVISRDNIKLYDAQVIVAFAGIEHPILTSKEVPLVWCSAYPDELFGRHSLQTLLLAYVRKNEGDQYLNNRSEVMKVTGTYDGYDFLILALKKS